MARKHALPGATRTLSALSHQGYTPQTAIADIVDNSIAAGANEVKIRFAPQLDRSTVVYIGDNGKGMDIDTLELAMGIGSPSEIANSRLSVYGVGMKAASLSFSRRFTVISKKSGNQACAASWDLTIQDDDPWAIDIDIASEKEVSILEGFGIRDSGTVVRWDNADFKDAVLDHRKLRGRKTSSANLESEISQYLSMVFHRYIEGVADGYQAVKIWFNEQLVEPWNPVEAEYLSDDWNPVMNEFFIDVDVNGTIESVPYTLKTYLLKNKNEAGPELMDRSKFGMKTQGIYPYREDRLLQNPDWLNVLSFHPDWNGLRVVLELDPRLDGLLRTDMKKSGITLPPEMWEALKEKLSFYSQKVRSEARRRKAEKRSRIDTQNMHNSSNSAINISLPEIEQPRIQVSPDGTSVVQTVFGDSVTELAQIDSSFTSRDARVQPVDDLLGGILFEPVLMGSDQVILLNKSHPFYQKIYLGLYDNYLAINGLDFLLYSLAHAELLTRTDRQKEQFRIMRTEMSNSLRQFVMDIDEPTLFDEEELKD
jgi:hypothetical protein